MKLIFIISLCLSTIFLHAQKPKTYCNPMNIDYGYTPIPDFSEWGRHRATADPVIVNFKNIYYLFGDENNLTLSGYQKEDKRVVLVSGISNLIITEEAGEFIGSLIPSSDEIILQIDEYSYNFNLTSGKVFYFVISKDIKNEEYIISG